MQIIYLIHNMFIIIFIIVHKNINCLMKFINVAISLYIKYPLIKKKIQT